jgi:hypothetical protein
MISMIQPPFLHHLMDLLYIPSYNYIKAMPAVFATTGLPILLK